MERWVQLRGSSGAVAAGARRAGRRGDLAEGSIQPRQEATSGPRGLAGVVASSVLSERGGGRCCCRSAARAGTAGAGKNQREPRGSLGTWLPCGKWTAGTPTPWCKHNRQGRNSSPSQSRPIRVCTLLDTSTRQHATPIPVRGRLIGYAKASNVRH